MSSIADSQPRQTAQTMSDAIANKTTDRNAELLKNLPMKSSG
jgi:hypothetical protein